MSGLVQGLRERAKWCNMQPGYGQIGFEVATAADRIIELEALLGNAVGAIIDSGGYCEGPHDVAAAIYRLTEERDGLRALIVEAATLSPVLGLEDHWFQCYWCDGEGDYVYERAEHTADCLWLRLKAVSAAGGAPGVSETHTDPKEAPDELR